jgi:Holliday junction resolvase RusA-like endonuclease
VVESSKGLKAWRAAVTWQAGYAAASLVSHVPLVGPLALTADFYFKRPKRPAHAYPMPDLDKLVRAIGDACKVAGLITDDSQFTVLSASKGWADDSGEREVGVGVSIHPVEME